MGEIYQSVILESMRGKRKRVNALIDTGSNINAISLKTALTLMSKSDILSSKQKLIKATNIMSDKYPIVFLRVIVYNESRIFPFAVIKGGFGTEALLGVRFLQQTDKTIDFKNDKLRFRKLSNRKGLWV